MPQSPHPRVGWSYFGADPDWGKAGETIAADLEAALANFDVSDIADQGSIDCTKYAGQRRDGVGIFNKLLALRASSYSFRDDYGR